MSKKMQKVTKIVEKKFKEMPPQQALEMMCIVGVGIGQFAACRDGQPMYYANQLKSALLGLGEGDPSGALSDPFGTIFDVPERVPGSTGTPFSLGQILFGTGTKWRG